MKELKILLADDHPLTLEGLLWFLKPSFPNVATVRDGRALVEEALRIRPDLIILDISLPLLNGIDAAIQIKKSLPDVTLLFVTMHANPAYVEAALNAGGTGYVLKSSAKEEILDAIKRVMSGEVYVTPSLASAASLRPVGDQGESAAGASNRLTAREREILQLIAEGRATKEIAFVLTISMHTVAYHRENIKSKLGVRSTAELTKYAMDLGLIS